MTSIFRDSKNFEKLTIILLFFLLSAVLSVANAGSLEETEEYRSLDLIGYNYTDRNIRNYIVDTQSGGSIRLSSPTSGGSGIVCCVRIATSKSDPIIVRVRWQVDGCTYLTKSTASGKAYKSVHDFYKEAFVEVHRPTNDGLGQLETHFYPDGSVRVFLTNDMSLPHVKLSEARPDKSVFSRCKNDEKPGKS